jgi:hypothetical protein
VGGTTSWAAPAPARVRQIDGHHLFHSARSALVININEGVGAATGLCPGWVSHVSTQICRCRLLAVCLLGGRDGDDGRSMRLLTMWRLNFPIRGPSRAEKAGVWLSTAIRVDPNSRQRDWLPSDVFYGAFCSLRAVMVPPSSETLSWARRMVPGGTSMRLPEACRVCARHRLQRSGSDRVNAAIVGLARPNYFQIDRSAVRSRRHQAAQAPRTPSTLSR